MSFVVALLMSFFFNDPATTEIYTLSLHDALPISASAAARNRVPSRMADAPSASAAARPAPSAKPRSEEHTSELQSRPHLVCRLLLEKKNKYEIIHSVPSTPVFYVHFHHHHPDHNS